MEVRSDRQYRFAVTPVEVWETLGRVDDYRRWWPWLRRFDAAALAEGDRWSCVVRPPVPYQLRFTVELVSVTEHERIDAVVTGDITGDATVELRTTDDGSIVRLRSALSPSRGPLRLLMRAAPAIGRFGHDWVLDTGLRQFRRRALGPGA